MSNTCPVNKYGQAILSGEKLMELVLQGKNIHHLPVRPDDEIELFLKHQGDLLNHTIKFLEEHPSTQTVEEFHLTCADEWMIPEEYLEFDVEPWLLSRCNTDAEEARVREEYRMYSDRGLVMLLRAFKYLVDTMRARRIVWGVGRGSAVASYILYIIGVHKVDSLKYNLPITDFLKEDNE